MTQVSQKPVAEKQPQGLDGLPIVGPLFKSMGAIFGAAARNEVLLKERIDTILRCPDNDAIPRVPNAGETEGETVIMHNGIKVLSKSLPSNYLRRLLKANRGVEEPQHEKVFLEIIKTLSPSPVMMDIGARNGFYSMWLKQMRPGARCVMVEPDKRQFELSKKNFALNNLFPQPVNAFVGMRSGRDIDGVSVTTVAELSQKIKADYIAVLHADIQGYEYELIRGAEGLLKDRGIDYLFLSTHSDTLHKDCRAFLENLRYVVVADIMQNEAYSDDGLLVMRRKELKGLENISLSRRSHEQKSTT